MVSDLFAGKSIRGRWEGDHRYKVGVAHELMSYTPGLDNRDMRVNVFGYACNFHMKG